MTEADRRLRDRASEALRHSHAGRVIVLASVAVVVLLNTLFDGLAGFFLLRGDITSYRASAAVGNGLTAVINIILLFLVWVLFDTLSRVERESDRLQTFIDHTYRRLR